MRTNFPSLTTYNLKEREYTAALFLLHNSSDFCFKVQDNWRIRHAGLFGQSCPVNAHLTVHLPRRRARHPWDSFKKKTNKTVATTATLARRVSAIMVQLAVLKIRELTDEHSIDLHVIYRRMLDQGSQITFISSFLEENGSV